MDPTTAKIQAERLLAAIRTKYISRIEALLNQGCSANNINPDCSSQHPLDLAIETNNLPAVSLLIARGAHTNLPIEPRRKHLALHRAVVRGNKDIVSEVLRHTADWRVVDADGASVLHLASEASCEQDEIVEIVRIFLDLGMDVDARTTRGETPLMIAGGRHRLPKVVDFLIERGADVNAQDCEGDSLIHRLLRDAKRNNGSSPEYLMGRLLSRGADANLTNEAGESPLLLASRARSLDAIEILLEHVADLADFRDELGRTILHVVLESSVRKPREDRRLAHVNSDEDPDEPEPHKACQVEKVVDFLLGKGLDVGVTDDEGNTALHTAVKQKKWFAVPKLLERFGDVNVRNKLGQTVLHATLSHSSPYQTGYEKAVGALMSREADLEIQDNHGLNALQLAVKYKHDWILELFKQKGADFGILTAKGESLMHLFVGNDDYNNHRWRPGTVGVLKLLIAQGCDVNATTLEDLSPLHVALMARNVDAARALTEFGADVHAEAADEKSTVHLATERCRYLAVRALARAGAHCDNVDGFGYAPLYYAAKIDARETTVCLLEAGADIDAVRIDDREKRCLARCREVRGYLCKLAHADLVIPRVFGVTRAEVLGDRRGIDEKFHEDCRREVKKMKGFNVGEDASLYDFLHSGFWRRIRWVNREELVDAVEFSKLRADFPIYCDIVRGRYSETLMGESALRAFRRIDRFALPDICVERVFGYLDNRSLSALGRVEKMIERKRTRLAYSTTCSASKKRRTE